MEFYGKIIAVTKYDLTRSDDGDPVMTVSTYDWNIRKKNFNVLRPGKGLGSYALIEFDTLPLRFKSKFIEKYGDPKEIMEQKQTYLPLDHNAQIFFHDYILPNGEHLPEDKQVEYTVNARVLNAMLDAYNTQRTMRRACNNNTPVIWSNIFAMCEELRDTEHHTLPKSEARLRDKLREYKAAGYECLVSKKFCNSNTLKITEAAGRQIIALRRCRVPVYTTKEILEEFNAIADKKGWKKLNSVAALTQYLERPEIKPQWYDAVYGELAAKQLFSRRNKTQMPSMRDSLWYGDGTKMNLFYRAFENGKTVVKSLYVYEVADAFSDTLLGCAIGTHETFDLQYNAFRMAIETSGHKPYEIVYDNQGGQNTKIAKAFFEKICRVSRPTAPYNGPSKTIENTFNRFQKYVMSHDWRFTGSNISSKSGWKINREFIEANKESLYTREEVIQAYHAYRAEWNSRPHHVTGIVRDQMYASSVNPETEAVSAIDMVDLFWIQTQAPSVFTADGITIQYRNQKYSYEVLTADGKPDYEWRRENTGREFYLKFDPNSMNEALLYEMTPMGLRYERTAYPYITVHRNIQEQREGEAAFLRMNDESIKTERVRRQIENSQLEMEHGVSPEQLGLRTPRLKGISEKEFERLADNIAVIIPEESEPIAIGEYTKATSNADYDPLSILNRL